MSAGLQDAVAAARRRLAALPRAVLLGLVHGYRLLFKAWLGNACRFEPSCSQYALDALHRHGAADGTLLTAGRLLRCHPWCAGGCDPVPARGPIAAWRAAARPAAAVASPAASPSFPLPARGAPAPVPTCPRGRPGAAGRQADPHPTAQLP